MKLKNLLSLKKQINWVSKFSVIDDGCGIQFIALDEEKIYKTLDKDSEQFSSDGLYLLNFAQRNYTVISPNIRYVCSDSTNLYFISEGEIAEQYHFIRYNKKDGQITHSDKFFLNEYRFLDSYLKNGILIFSSYIVFEHFVNNAWHWRIMNYNFEIVFEFTSADGQILSVGENNLFLQQDFEQKKIISICFENGTIEKEVSIEMEFGEYEVYAFDNQLFLHSEMIDYQEKYAEAKIKILNQDLQCIHEIAFSTMESMQILGYEVNSKHLLLKGYSDIWDTYTRSEPIILINLKTGKELWRVDLREKNFELASVSTKPVFWKQKIILNVSALNGNSKGLLVLDQKTGELLFYKGIRGIVCSIIPWGDGVYIQSAAGAEQEKIYYYKLSE